MKYPFILMAVGLSLTACSDRPAATGTAASAAAGAAAVVSAKISKAELARPAAIPAGMTATDTCSLDLIAGKPAGESNPIADKTRSQWEGWAANVAAGTNPQAVFIELDGPGKAYLSAGTGGKRPDVATHFSKPALLNAGWSVQADLSALAAGTYKVRLIQVSNGSALVCETKRSIVLS